jgi:hypothetical protein
MSEAAARSLLADWSDNKDADVGFSIETLAGDPELVGHVDVFAYNARAIAAYGKVGFVEDGRRREAIRHDGRWYDNVLMSILEREWRERLTA